MATGNPCKKCKRNCMVPGIVTGPFAAIPPIFIDARQKFNVIIDSQAFIDFITDGIQNNGFCDGDISLYCLEKIIEAIRIKISEVIGTAMIQWGPLFFGRCYNMYITDGIAITAKCECNDNDISNGNGPPNAKVEVVIDGAQLNVVDCGITI
jgi:hypothetical protein